jgi:hypothetical protein
MGHHQATVIIWGDTALYTLFLVSLSKTTTTTTTMCHRVMVKTFSKILGDGGREETHYYGYETNIIHLVGSFISLPAERHKSKS